MFSLNFSSCMPCCWEHAVLVVAFFCRDLGNVLTLSCVFSQNSFQTDSTWTILIFIFSFMRLVFGLQVGRDFWCNSKFAFRSDVITISCCVCIGPFTRCREVFISRSTAIIHQTRRSCFEFESACRILIMQKFLQFIRILKPKIYVVIPLLKIRLMYHAKRWVQPLFSS